MKKLFLFFLFLFAYFQPQAQSKLDSLWTVWHNPAMADTNRLDAIRKICQKIKYGKPDTLLVTAQLYYDLADTLDEPKHKGVALGHLAHYFNVQGDFSQAISYYQESSGFFEMEGYQKGIAGNLINTGNIYFNQGKNEAAIESYHKGMAICEAIGEKGYLANAQLNLANVYNTQGNEKVGIDL